MDPIKLAVAAQLRASDIIFAAGRLSADPQFPEVSIAEIRRSMQRIEEALTEFEAGEIVVPKAAE